MFWIFTRVMLIAAALGVILGGGIWYYKDHGETAHNTEEAPQHSTRPLRTMPNIATLLVQLDPENRRLLWCEQQHCQQQDPPENIPHDAVFDGQWWYYYADGALRRINAEAKEQQTIVDTTPLVAPREYSISPDGQYIAYWLDNIDEPEEQLTELWVYNTATQSTYLVVEKLTIPEITTKIHWNKAGSHLWFNQKDETLIVALQPPGIVAQGPAYENITDIDPTGTKTVHIQQGQDKSELIIAQEGKDQLKTTVRGTIPYAQWFDDETLIYAVQDLRGITFWQQKGKLSTHLARTNGTLQAAHGQPANNIIALVIQKSSTSTQVQEFDVATKTIADHSIVPQFGDAVLIAKVQAQESGNATVAGITAPLDDAQLTAFVEKNLATITNFPAAKPIRLITTEKQNTVYVDYSDGTVTSKRLLITVKDAINPEWSKIAKYESERGEWKVVEGQGATEPAPRSVYEWEDKLKKWIEK